MFTAVLANIFFCAADRGGLKIQKNRNFFFRSNCQKWAQTRSKWALAEKISFLQKSTISDGQNEGKHLPMALYSPCLYKKLF